MDSSLLLGRPLSRTETATTISCLQARALCLDDWSGLPLHSSTDLHRDNGMYFSTNVKFHLALEIFPPSRGLRGCHDSIMFASDGTLRLDDERGLPLKHSSNGINFSTNVKFYLPEMFPSTLFFLRHVEKLSCSTTTKQGKSLVNQKRDPQPRHTAGGDQTMDANQRNSKNEKSKHRTSTRPWTDRQTDIREYTSKSRRSRLET